MRIMYLMFSFTIGGTERLVVDICNQMAKNENKVYLYIINDNYEENIINTLDSKVVIERQNRKPASGGKLQTMLILHKYIKENNIDVVHCNAFDTPELLMLAKVLNPKLKICYTIHDVGQYQNLNKIRVHYRNFICNSLIAISKSVAQDISRYGAAQQKIHIVYNAIDLKKFSRKSKKEFNPMCPVIGNVARVDPAKKGQDILIRAIAIVKKEYSDIKCYFAGAADEKHQDDLLALQKLVKEKQLEENIVFLGNVNDIPSFLETVDIFTLPSRFEGFGISLVEAMAMGLPVIANNLDGPAEVLEDGQKGHLFNNNNEIELSKVIIEILNNYKRELLIAQSNVDYIVEKFDISKMCDDLAEIYRK